MRRGYGSPEGVITGPPGAVYTQRDGAFGKVLWIKQFGVGNTGWLPVLDTAIGVSTAPRLKPAAAGPPVTAMLTRFQSGHGWTYNVGSGVAAADDVTVTGPFASQTARLQVGGTGASYVERNGLSVNLTTANLVIWVKWNTDPANTNPSVTIYAGDGTLANAYTWNVYREQTPSYNVDGWSVYELMPGDGIAIGTPALATVARIRLRAEATTGEVWLGGLGTRANVAAYPNGVVTIGFDDSYETTRTIAGPLLAGYGWAGVSYTIVDVIGTPTFMTVQQNRELQDWMGWEIAAHAYTSAAHTNRYTSLTDAELHQEFSRMKAWMLENGFTSDSWASPGGQSDLRVWGIARRYFSTHRGVNHGYPKQSPRPVYPAQLRGPSFLTAGLTSAAQMVTYIGQVKAAKAWGFLTFHQIAGASSGQSISLADITTVLNEVQAQGLAVRTAEQVLRGI